MNMKHLMLVTLGITSASITAADEWPDQDLYLKNETKWRFVTNKAPTVIEPGYTKKIGKLNELRDLKIRTYGDVAGLGSQWTDVPVFLTTGAARYHKKDVIIKVRTTGYAQTWNFDEIDTYDSGETAEKDIREIAKNAKNLGDFFPTVRQVRENKFRAIGSWLGLSSATVEPRHVLGLGKNPDRSSIAKAYKDLSLRIHPDRNPANTELATELFKIVQNAYNALLGIEKFNPALLDQPIPQSVNEEQLTKSFIEINE